MPNCTRRRFSLLKSVMRFRTAVMLTTLVAFGMRVHGLFANTFHADEALFALWARLIAVGRDPWLLTVPVDKPPLLFYTQAVFYPLFGPVEWAARWPSLMVAVVAVPLTAVWAHRLTGDRRKALTAAVLVAASPFAIQFAPTAFTDGLLLGLILAAAVAATFGRAAWSGAWWALALATKYQAVLYAPFLWWLLFTAQTNPSPKISKRIARWTAGALPALLLLVAWSAGRGLWAAQMDSYGGVRPVRPWEMGPRLWAWAGLWVWLLGAGWLLLSEKPASNRATAGWSAFFIAFAGLHWLAAVPVWDRYLLPLVPLAAVWAADRLPSGRWGGRQRWVLLGVGLGLLWQATAARQGTFALGASPRADQGAARIAAHLIDKPYGTVLYDHWYSWHWRYHFFDKGVYVAWVPHPAALEEDVQAFAPMAGERYIALPADGRANPMRRAIRAAGYRLHPVALEDNIILYQIVPPEG